MLTTLGIVVLSLLVAIALHWSRGAKNNKSLAPPGPWLKLPFLGHLPFLGLEPQKELLKWSKKYGPMFRIQLGSFETVVINDSRLIRKAFNSSALAGRPRMTIFDDMGSDRKDLNFSDGEHIWDHRLFFRENFKIVASSSAQPLEDRILAEFDNAAGKLKVSGQAPILMHGFFHRVICNILVDVFLSAKCELNEKDAEDLVREIQSLGETMGLTELLGMFIPKVCTVAPQWSGRLRRIKSVARIHVFLNRMIQMHEDTLVKGQPRDILDAYLERSKEATEPNSSFHPEAGHLTPFLWDILVAGMETTSTQLEWIMYYMVKHPEMQVRVQDEIDNFIGNARRPCSSDRTSLTYTEAVIQETFRISSLMPFGLCHSALEDYELNGYLIPKDTTIIGNLYAAHHDPAVWGDPEVFRPERFIDDVTGRLKRCEELVIPFSCGKRRCSGEDLARHEIFLFTVSIFQQFRVRSAEILPPEGGFGISVAPRPFRVIFTPRV